MVSLSVRVINAPKAVSNKPTSGGGGSSRKPQISVQVTTPEAVAVSKGGSSPQPTSAEQLIQRGQDIKEIARQRGRAFTQSEARRYIGGTIKGTNVTYARAVETPQGKEILQQIQQTAKEQKQQNLNARQSSKNNGYSSDVRVSSSENIPIPSQQSSVITRRSFVDRLKDSFRKNVEKEKGTYVSALGTTGAYVTESQAGAKGTVIAQPPTPEELTAIETARSKGNLLDRPASEVIKISKEYNKLTKDFDKLTPDEQTKVIADLVKIGATVNPVTNQIEPPKIGIGFGANKQEVSISELDTRNKVQLYASVGSKLVGEQAKELATQRVVSSTNVNEPRTYNVVRSDEPLFTVTRTTPTQQAGTITGDLNKQQLFFESTTVPVGTPQQIGKVVESVTRVAPYFTPIGTQLFLAEQTYNLGAETGTKGASGVLSYGKNFGVEAATVGTLGLFKFAKAIAPETVVTRTTTTIPSTQPNIFVNPTLVRTVITPEGKTLQEFSFDILGRARRGAELSNVEVVRTRPIFRALGIKGDVIYSSIDRGVSYAFNTLGGVVKESTLASRYKKALDLLTKQKVESGLTKEEALSQARRELRSYNPSPANVQITGKGNVIQGTGQDLVLGSGDVSYVANPTKIGNRMTRGFTSVKDSSISRGVQVTSKGETQYYLIEPDIQRSYFKNPTQEFMKLSQEGKTTRRVQQLTGLTEVGKLELPFDIGNQFGARNIPFTVISEGSLSRQTIPLKKAVTSGTSKIFVADLKTPTIDYGQPFKNVPVTPVVEKVQAQFTQQQAKELAKTLQDIYGKQVLEGAKKVVSTLPKPNLGFTKAPKSSVISSTTKGVTLPVGFVGTSSSFAGTGQYEQTVGTIYNPNLPTINREVIRPVTEVKVNTITQIKPENNFRLYTGTTNEFDLGTKEFLATGIDTNIKQQERLREQVRTETKQQLRQSQALRNLFVQINARRINPKPIEPTPIGFIPLIPSTKEGISKKILDELSGSFQVFTRKFGKDILLGKVSSKGEASKLLKSQLTGTLRASGYVVNPIGKRLKASELNLGRGFRQAKRDRFRVVQERRTRLSSFGEKSEIKSARRKTLLIS